MGNSNPRYAKTAPDGKEHSVRDLQRNFARRTVPMEVAVAHYTPSSFPLVPIINKHSCKIIADSWQIVVKNEIKDSYGNSTSGITAFYNEFYERLEVQDTSGRFDAVLTRNVDGMSKLQAKGAILIRIIKFVMAIEEDSREVQYSLYMLGKSHALKGIRPWQYTVFVQTLLLTLSSRLGTNASNSVTEAWVNMFAFVMQSMLPPAIENQIVETEISVNVSSEFASDRVNQELVAAEEMKNMQRRFKKGSGGQSSDPGGGTDSGASPR